MKIACSLHSIYHVLVCIIYISTSHKRSHLPNASPNLIFATGIGYQYVVT